MEKKLGSLVERLATINDDNGITLGSPKPSITKNCATFCSLKAHLQLSYPIGICDNDVCQPSDWMKAWHYPDPVPLLVP